MGNASPKLSDDDPMQVTADATKMNMKDLLKEEKIFRQQFPEGHISKKQFSRMVSTFLPDEQKDPAFIDRLFNAFAGKPIPIESQIESQIEIKIERQIDFHKFMRAMALCSSENREDKLKFCFYSLDVKGKGFLGREEIKGAVEHIFKQYPGLDVKLAIEEREKTGVRLDTNTPIIPYTPDKFVARIFDTVKDNDGIDHLTCDYLVHFMKSPTAFSKVGLNLIFRT